MFRNVHRGAKLAVLVATGIVSLGGVAAATGSLPSPAQTAAHDALGAAGIDVPDGDGTTVATGETPVTTVDTTPAGDPTTTSVPADGEPVSSDAAPDGAKGPDPNGPAKHGLCTAYAAGRGGDHGNKHSSTAFRALTAAADTKGETVAEFCADATPGGRTDTATTTTSTTGSTEPDVAVTEPAPPAPTTTPALGNPDHPGRGAATVRRGAGANGHGNPHGS